MNRNDLTELHYITPISNLPSIMSRGVLWHRDAVKVRHESVAMPEVQEARSRKRVPQGRLLHEYVNLYFCARNPMMYRRKELYRELCVLQISTDVLELAGVVIADGNAASGCTGFWSSPQGLAKVEKGLVFAEYWTNPDPNVAYHSKRVKCAEVLVPRRVETRYLMGAYVAVPDAAAEVRRLVASFEVTVDAHLFFR